MATLRLVPVSGPPIDVIKDPSAVGRDPSCDVVVTDGSVSRRHARLEQRGDEWWVVDQGSANGTFVNSLRVAEQVLKPGQELRFGAQGFRVDLVQDPEATVATPILADESAGAPPPAASGVTQVPPQAPAPPLPPPVSTPPPLPRPAVPPVSPRRPTPPVRQMPAGPAGAKKGRSPFFWIAIGCCGCLLLVAIVAGILGGGVYMATKGAADAGHAWLGAVREGRTDEAVSGLSNGYRERLTRAEFREIASTIQRSTDATFFSRSVENERAKLAGVLTGPAGSQPIEITLVKEGDAWKVDDVSLGPE